MAAKNVFSGVQPSGDLHIGNYLGAIKQWVAVQETLNPEDSFYFSIVDLHAITVPFEPETLRKNVLDVASWFIAAGMDPQKVNIFVQSENPDHPYIAWIFNCITPMGWLERMIQYKEKSDKQGERASVGLFSYPTLMATDILLYDPQEVPVGEDQKQHVELTRDIAERFNKMFGETFTIPKVVLNEHVARVMSLQDPLKKMSKSDENQNGVIRLTDDAETIRAKVRRAVTDSGTEIKSTPDKPAFVNLLAIYAEFSGLAVKELEARYQGKQYGEFKSDLAEVIVEALTPMQKKHAELLADASQINAILNAGLEKARARSTAKLQDVMRVTGLSRK